jgi:hypothetical protein
MTPLSAATPTTTSRSPSPRPILPPRFPTGSSADFVSSSPRIPSQLHDAKSDLDPTEWKPKIRRHETSTHSEAFRYLSRFHSSPAVPGVSASLRRRHHPSTTSIASLSVTHTSSVAQSPTTSASSLSNSVDLTSHMSNYKTRPLPLRHDPSYCSSAGVTKGIDLVMPYVPPTPESLDLTGSSPDEVHFHGGVWEKLTVKNQADSAADSAADDLQQDLGALLSPSTSEPTLFRHEQ